MYRKLIFIWMMGCCLVAAGCEVQSKEGNRKKQKTAEQPEGLQQLSRLDKQVRESSGLSVAGEQGTYYTHGDAGTMPVVFVINEQGKVLNKLRLPVPNRDWEGVASDEQGNVYVGDFGNNENNRRNLVVYKFSPSDPDKVEAIEFSYPDQNAFPPKKKEQNFDCEAMVWHRGKLYLFTRDRGRGKASKVYTLPDKPGQHLAKLVTTLELKGQITDAALSPGNDQLALLGREELFLFSGDGMEKMLQSEPRSMPLSGIGQTEGIEFKNSNTLIISTEEGSLYQLRL